jgi:hypothetical protein
VQLTVVAAMKVAENKKKIDKWNCTALKAATKLHHTEQKKGKEGLSANQLEHTIKKEI